MERMSRFGAGPLIALYSIGVTGLMAGLRKHFPAYFSLFGFQPFIKPVALIWIGLGLVFWLWSAVTVMRAYKLDNLCTTGTYRFCRHPLYAGFAVFVLPGLLLWLDTWLALVAAVVLMGIVKRCGRAEEEYLLQRFGAPYEEYRKRVPAVLPIGFLFRS